MKVILGENDHLVVEIEGTDGMFIVSYGKEVKHALTVHSTMPDDDGRCDLIYYTAYGEAPTDEECIPAKPVLPSGTQAVYSAIHAKRQGRNTFRRLSDGKLVLAVPVHGVGEGDHMKAFLEGVILYKVSKYMGPMYNIYHCYQVKPYKSWVVIHPVFDPITGMELHIDYIDENKETSTPSGFEYMPGMRDSEVFKQWKEEDAAFDARVIEDEEGEEEEPVEPKEDKFYGKVLQGRNDVYKQTSTNMMCWVIYIPKTKSGIAGSRVLDEFQDLRQALSEYFSTETLAGIGITSEGTMPSGKWVVFMPSFDPHAGVLIQTSMYEDVPVVDGRIVRRVPKGFSYVQGMSNYDLALMVHDLI